MPIISGSGPTHVSSGTVIQAGSGTPLNAVTPSQKGALYQDTTNGSLYIAVGTTSASWLVIGGAFKTPDAPGVSMYTDASSSGLRLDADGTKATMNVQISDTVANENSGAGIFFTGTGVDGAQYVQIILGPASNYSFAFLPDGSVNMGTYTQGGTGIGYWGLAPGGAEYLKAVTTPADGAVATHQRLQWYDDTATAPKLRFKQKDSAGALFTGISEVASPITSGALPTVALVSGTGTQIIVARAAETVTPFTGDGTNNAATCVIALSPDDVTYSTLDTLSIAAAINLTGALALSANIRVPAGWYLKLTATHGTLGTTTYY